MAVRQLPDDLVNRIAAGEVVERPASVIKELVENALDAGATRINITTATGGKSLMRIEDDGCGMGADDLQLSIQRHATSKLDADNLDNIQTLGFRGEALASIGSVSDFSISSRPHDAESGLQLIVRRGAVGDIMPHGMNVGTIVEVKNLFAAIPARLKFLKSDRAETGAITDTIKRLAMANPEVHFMLSGADRQPLNWPAQTGEGALRNRVAQVMGQEFNENAVTLGYARHGVVVAGLAALPTFTKANSLSQFYFVNGRSVRDKILLGAVKAAYSDLIFRDRFPVISLFVSVDPQEVDVNVHPAKTELRFRDGGAVRSAVVRAIATAMSDAGFRASSSVGEKTLEAFKVPEPTTPPLTYPATNGSVLPSFGSGMQAARHFDPMTAPTHTPNGAAQSFESTQEHQFAEPSARFEPIDVSPETTQFPLGVARAQMFENFIVAQSGDALVLIDQHAAHERLVYERFKAQLTAGPVASQAQLIPVVIELPDEDCARLEEAAPQLENFGLSLERFGPNAVAISATPALLGKADIAPLVKDLADGLAEWDSSAALTDKMDAVIARMACHGSVRSGRRLQGEEMNALLREMEATPHSGQCIHGRPTYVELKLSDIERLFGRS